MPRSAPPVLRLIAAVIACMLAARTGQAGLVQAKTAPSEPAGIEFFERQIRPLLAENCYRCHSAKEHKSGLRLDSVAGILAGGQRGPDVVPGEPEKSRLIRAVSYADPDLQMPPPGKLKDEQIAALVAWVKMGAPGPREQPAAAGADKAPVPDFRERLEHWAYQPVRRPELPTVKQRDWPTSPVDYFILSKLEQAGLPPAPPADKRTLIRRVTFDLIGLPPTPEDVAAFLADDEPDAYARLVDRLLESPHYGERWARHWLDLVRFAETLGHEFDFDIYNAWRYRDYCIRAFNADLPYNQFVLEHVAGDLLPEPRRHPTEGYNESVIGTGFFWLGEGKHSPVDVRQEQADRMDNQIDVFGKAFLGQTIGCARCHDHKFDPIAARDYYALAGYLKSSRYQQAFIDPPERIREKAHLLAELNAAVAQRVRETVVPTWIEQAGEMSRYLLAARAVARGTSLAEAAEAAKLDAGRLQRWVDALARDDVQRPEHPLFAWVQAASADAEGVASAVQTTLQQVQHRSGAADGSTLFDDFSHAGFDGWFVTGDAFGGGPSRAAVVLDPAAKARVRLMPAGQAHSGLLSRKLEGVMRSRTFTIDANYIHYLAAGRASRINLVIDGFTLIRNPIYGGLILDLDDDALAWRTMDVSMWRGQRAYIEIVDSTTPNPTFGTEADAAGDRPGDGYVVVDEIRFSDDRKPPVARAYPLNEQVLSGGIDSLEALALRYQTEAVEAIKQLCRDAAPACDAEIIDWLLQNELLDAHVDDERLADLRQQRRIVEEQIPRPRRALAMADGTGEDEYVFVRGSYKTPGERAPRRLLAEICGEDQPEPTKGSGRLALARRLVDENNPLTARVMVNRIWEHHFGTGIVATPDDFGHMGQPPTHPELLDYLASEFVRQRWSIKAMHRLMVLSSTYRMSNQVDGQAASLDPPNHLLHHMPIRRLEAEAIRDNVLAVSGGLHLTLYGRGVAPYLTPFMEGRGRPKSSGPLDGDGCRSIYINVRRNFLTPMFLAFDYPIPFTARGRRGTSNVPAQALTMMNSPFVVEQAHKWAARIVSASDKSVPERIRAMYLTAFARPPTESELNDAVQFLEQQAKRYGDADAAEVQAWADLCHVLMNVKEFIFVR